MALSADQIGFPVWYTFFVPAINGFALFLPLFALPCISGTGGVSFFSPLGVQSGRFIPCFAMAITSGKVSPMKNENMQQSVNNFGIYQLTKLHSILHVGFKGSCHRDRGTQFRIVIRVHVVTRPDKLDSL